MKSPKERHNQSIKRHLDIIQNKNITQQFSDNRHDSAQLMKLQSESNRRSYPIYQLKKEQTSSLLGTIQKEDYDSGYEADVEDNVLEDPGKYLGYTLGGSRPTLYFSKGHYTQVHSDSKNVGWHPNKGDRHFIKNINPDMHSYYQTNRSQWSRKLKTKFGKKIEDGVMDEQNEEGLMMEGDVHIDENGNESTYLHPSRGRLIAPSDSQFNKKYNASYAKKIIKRGYLAENEA